MKRKVLSLFLIVFLAFSGLYGCGNEPEEHRITFYAEETVHHTIKTKGNVLLTFPRNPSRVGYTFEGWYFDKDVWHQPFLDTHYADKPLTEDVSVYAKFRQNYVSCNIYCYADGNLHATIKTAGNEVISLPSAPTKEYYTFMGWYFDDETFTQQLTTDTYKNKKLSQNVNVYAKFKLNDGVVLKYDVNFIADGVVVHTINTSGKQELVLPSDPRKEGYIFMGWYFDEGTFQNKFDQYSFVNVQIFANVNIYAKFEEPEPPKFTISFKVDESVVHTYLTAGHEIVTLPENPVKEGYIFDNWYYTIADTLEDETVIETEFVFTGNEYESSKLNADLTVYAKFIDEDSVQIIFYVNDVEYYSVHSLGNEVIELPATPYDDNKTFMGWYFDNETFTQEFTANTFENEPITQSEVKVYAKMVPDVYESNLAFELSTDGTYYIVAGRGECTAPNIEIPETYNDLPVKEIKEQAFYRDTILQKVICGKNVEFMDEWAFSWCDKLTKFVFAENSNFKEFSAYSFNCSKALKSIHIPKGVTELKQYNFAQCPLESITFEEVNNITKFDDYALYGTSIKTLEMSSNLTYIGENCFSQCAKLNRIKMTKSIKTIEEGAFNDCRKLAYVEVEDIASWCDVDIQGCWGVPFLWANGFYNEAGERVKELVIPEGVTHIRKFVFADCTLLEKVTIPSTVVHLGSCAFADVLRMKELNYNARNATIEYFHSASHYHVFEHCGVYTLTAGPPGQAGPVKYIKLNIGATVEKIPKNLFAYTSAAYMPMIKEINFLGSTPPEFGETWIPNSLLYNLVEKLTVPVGTEEAYAEALGSRFDSFFPTDTEPEA